jgi:hypothetical protein
MGHLLKFWRLNRREKYFFCEAAILLILSTLFVKTIAFRYIDKFLSAHWDHATVSDFAGDEDFKLINLSLSRSAKLLPQKNLCLSRSIAALIMLRRRGIPAVIVAGVKFTEDLALHAHAWIHTGHDVPGVTLENSTFTAVVKIGQEP